MLPSLKKLTIPLLSLGLLTACAKTEVPVAIATDKLCAEGWKHQSISKHDKLTDGTASQIEGSNKARPEWGCEYGHDRAKGAKNG